MAATGNTFFFPWEVALMEWLQTHLGNVGISIISVFSMFGEELLLILIVGFVYWSYDKKLGRINAKPHLNVKNSCSQRLSFITLVLYEYAICLYGI